MEKPAQPIALVGLVDKDWAMPPIYMAALARAALGPATLLRALVIFVAIFAFAAAMLLATRQVEARKECPGALANGLISISKQHLCRRWH